MAAVWKVDATQILSRSEIAQVLADMRRKAKRSVNTRQNLIIFRLASCCGLRVSELGGIVLSDIHLGIDRPYIHIRKTVGKGEKARRVPLWWDASTLLDIESWKEFRLSQGAQPSDFFVCSQDKGNIGNQLDRRNTRNRFKTACRCLGSGRVKEITIHHGRHSFVSHALEGGRSLAEVRDAAGHANIATTSIYTHVVQESEATLGNLFDFDS